MSSIAFYGSIESGFIYALVALGVLISFKLLDFPDMTADGSFPLGGAVCAVCLVKGLDPWLATLAGAAAGFCAGLVTAFLNVRFKIMNLLAGILVMVALYSINLRIVGAPNQALINVPQGTVFDPFVNDGNSIWIRAVVLAGIVVAVKIVLDWLFATEIGMSMRATGANPRMARAQGINTGKMVVIGMGISNALVALGGSMYVQSQGGYDISIGMGTIVIGLAAVIIGEALFPAKRFFLISLGVVVGSLLYRFFIQLALGSDYLQVIGLGPQDLNLITALLVIAALVVPQLKSKLSRKAGRFAQ